jgi:hypothetical protein
MSTPFAHVRTGTLVAAAEGVADLVLDGRPVRATFTPAQADRVRALVEARRPHTDTPAINHATEVPVDVSALTVRFKPGKNTSTNRDAVKTSIQATINALGISTDDDPVIVDEAAIKAAVYSGAPGLVRDVDWSGTDATLAAGEVAVPAGVNSITFSE